MAHEVPPLAYDYNALEPHIDEQTMRIHHDKHHGAYVTKLNAAIDGTELASWDVEKLMTDINQIPADKRTAVQNNGGGHANHTLFWQTMSGSGGGEPSGDLASAIDGKFGSFAAFKETFTDAATNRFGSGWAWLVKKSDGVVDVYSTANQDSPLMQGDTPLLGLDVWEHAYYLKYQNLRPDYIAAFFNVTDWDQVAANFGG